MLYLRGFGVAFGPNNLGLLVTAGFVSSGFAGGSEIATVN